MGLLGALWRWLTQTKALEETSGQHETAFFDPVLRVMYLTGLSSSDRSISYLVYRVIIRTMTVAILSCELWYFFSMSASSLDGVVDFINATVIQLIALYRYKIMLHHKDIFKKLAMAMKSPHFDISTPERRKILDHWLQNNDKYFKLLLLLGTCTLAVWNLFPLMDDIEYNLAIAVRIPFDYATPNRYPVTYAVVLVCFSCIAYFVMVNDLIMQSHLMHLLCQYNVLGNCFENILQDCGRDVKGLDENNLHLNEEFIQKYFKRLGDLVEQHTFILSNTLDLRRILSIPMLGQITASSILLCFAGYQVTATATNADITKFLMSLLYLGYNMFELFIFCRWCHEIQIQNENIRSAVYFSGWERVAMVAGVRARLLIVAARAGRPLVLTAGGVYDLSLTSYATIIKTSYSALTVLLRVQNK